MVAQDFLKCLGKVKLKHGHDVKSQRWASIRTALRTIWSREHINELARKLGDYRAQLTLRVLLILNAHFEAQGQRLSKIQEGNKDVIEVLSHNHASLQSTIAGLRQDIHQKCIPRGKTPTGNTPEEMYAAALVSVLTTGDDVFCTSARSAYPFRQPTTPPRETLKPHTSCHAPDYSLNNIDAHIPMENRGLLQRATICISNALYFRRITDREFSISEAHKKTFEWIFTDQEMGTARWNSFSIWLKSGSGCFWVNGKAGSGKSTLLKYLHTANETSALLRQWAGSSSLITASYFFWYAGTSLQRSQEGLLRSLLLATLDQRPGLAPILFPNLFRANLVKKGEGFTELSYSELKEAFITLVSLTPPGLKVFFIIDGLDEYEGDLNELFDLFARVATSDSTKILLSSRPLPACVEVFSTWPQLRLQDLTRPDIAIYTKDKLTLHPLMKRLTEVEGGASDRIVHEITEKACGVFLWVVLVVRSLIRGLQAYDSLSDLLERLDELPLDLEKLYSHMFDSMSSQYRRQGSKLLQLVMYNTENLADYPMTPLQLSFAEDEDYTKATRVETRALTSGREQWHYESIEGRMRSRCCGLIEIQDSPPSAASLTGQKVIGFLHRSVVEFLRINNIWNDITSETCNTGFDVQRAILNSSLLEMKTKPPCARLPINRSTAYRSVLRIFSQGRQMKDDGDGFFDTFLLSLRDTMHTYWCHPNLSAASTKELQTLKASISRSSNLFKLSHFDTVLFFAACTCQDVFAELTSDLYSRGPLDHAVHLEYETPECLAKYELHPRKMKLVAYLLIHYLNERTGLLGAVPDNILACSISINRAISVPPEYVQLWNKQWHHECHCPDYSTVWYVTLNYANQMARDLKALQVPPTDFIDNFLDFIVHMMLRGADLDGYIKIAGGSGCHLSTPQDVLSRFASELSEEFRSEELRTQEPEAMTTSPSTISPSLHAIQKFLGLKYAVKRCTAINFQEAQRQDLSLHHRAENARTKPVTQYHSTNGPRLLSGPRRASSDSAMKQKRSYSFYESLHSFQSPISACKHSERQQGGRMLTEYDVVRHVELKA